MGYLLKERVFDFATVVDALRRIMDGETVVDPTIVARLVARRRPQDPLSQLTDRELRSWACWPKACRTAHRRRGSPSRSAPSKHTYPDIPEARAQQTHRTNTGAYSPC